MAAFSPSGKMILFTKKKMTMEMPPLSTVVPMLWMKSGTVDVNPYQLGMEAASQTINHIENPNLLATKIIVPHKLIPRESCCPPPEV